MKHREIWSSAIAKKISKKKFYQSIFLSRDTAIKPWSYYSIMHITFSLDFKKQHNEKNTHHSSRESHIIEDFFFTSVIKKRLHEFISLPYVFSSVPVHKTYTKPYGQKNKAMQMNDRN